MPPDDRAPDQSRYPAAHRVEDGQIDVPGRPGSKRVRLTLAGFGDAESKISFGASAGTPAGPRSVKLASECGARGRCARHAAPRPTARLR
jgi:hypothetical protein